MKKKIISLASVITWLLTAFTPAIAGPLHDAAMKGNLPLVKNLIDKGADVNETLTNGLMPIHMAASFGHAPVVKYLLEKGARADATDRKGRTPLHQAAYGGKIEVMRLLIAKGAPVNAVEDSTGSTPLHWAAMQGQLEAVKLLVEAKADIHAKSKYGRTPLAYAIESDRTAVEAYLRQKGAKE